MKNFPNSGHSCSQEKSLGRRKKTTKKGKEANWEYDLRESLTLASSRDKTWKQTHTAASGSKEAGFLPPRIYCLPLRGGRKYPAISRWDDPAKGQPRAIQRGHRCKPLSPTLELKAVNQLLKGCKQNSQKTCGEKLVTTRSLSKTPRWRSVAIYHLCSRKDPWFWVVLGCLRWMYL